MGQRAVPEGVAGGFEKRLTFDYSPHEAGGSNGMVLCLKRRGFVPPWLTPEQDALI